jgi:hypothetical protein
MSAELIEKAIKIKERSKGSKIDYKISYFYNELATIYHTLESE